MSERAPPLYHVGQVLRITLSWASDLPARPVLDVMWDEPWGCWTYSFPRSLIRIEQSHLAPTGEPDIDPHAWALADGRQEDKS